MKKKSGNQMRKVSIVMERFWLLIALGSLAAVTYIFASEGVDERTLQYLIFPALAGAMFAFRYFFRKRMEGKDRS
jgi:uncharacterized membrane protein